MQQQAISISSRATGSSGGADARPGGAAPASNWVLVRRLLALGWRHRAGCVTVLAQQVLLVVLGLMGLGLTGLSIDALRAYLGPDPAAVHWPLSIAPPASWPPLAVIVAIAGGILVVALVQGLAKYFAAVSAAHLTQQIVTQLRSDVYDKLQRLSFRFFDSNESGSIINRVAGDVQAVRLFVDGVIVQVLSVLLSLAIYVAYMLSVHVPLTLACLATTPLLWFGAVWLSRTVRPGYFYNARLVDRLVRILSENIQGMFVVKGFAREPQEIAKFQAANAEVRDQKRGIFARICVFQPLMGFFTQVNMMVLLAYGGYLVINGQMALGAGLFVFANLLQQFANQVSQVINITNSIQSSLIGAQRVFEVLDAPLEIVSPARPVRLERVRGAVRYEKVSFGYRPNEEVLHEVDFAVKAGQCVAVVGATGAGKSTLVSLIPRFYDPTGGRVLVDGIDVRDVHLDDLRRKVGIVFQESFLFSNTVAANIAFGNPQASRQQIARAAQLAAAEEFIRDLPHGYDTVIGEYGSNLSGGQRQRLSIARAVLLEPPILILDDALASVDPETEHEIMRAIENAMHGRTTFVIAHRLSTLRRADLVVVLDQGRIVEIGTHLDLMSRGGHYRQAAAVQMSSREKWPASEIQFRESA